MGERCRHLHHRHSESNGEGICSVCLKERLLNLSQVRTGVGNNVYVQLADPDGPAAFKRSQSVCRADEFKWKTSKSFSLSALFNSDPHLHAGHGNFISLDFDRKEAKPASWISSLLRKKKASRRNSFSGRPSLDNIVLGKKMASYEKELVRRHEALKAGGWEVQLSPAGRRCSDCDADENHKERDRDRDRDTDYFSDSSVVSAKYKMRSLFNRESSKAASVQGVSEEKKNPRVANCMVPGASENGGGESFGVRKNSSWAKTLASPLWKPKTGRRKKEGYVNVGSFPFGSSALW